MKCNLLGPQANDVANDVLLAVLCMIGAGGDVDKWAAHACFLFNSELTVVFKSAVERAKNLVFSSLLVLSLNKKFQQKNKRKKINIVFFSSFPELGVLPIFSLSRLFLFLISFYY